MTQPLFSILIPCTPDRISGMAELLKVINKGRMIPALKDAIDKFGNEFITKDEFIDTNGDCVECIVYCDNKTISIGEKREKMYLMTKGLYSIQIDSDDLLAPNAIQLILEAIKSNPEIPCITFKERCMMNGEYKSSNHSIKYDIWQDNFDGYDYCRSPFYKDVIRTDIAQSVPFPHIRYNEDEQWSMSIKPLLTNEIHIDSELYYYNYEPKDSHEERYGLNSK